MNLGQGGLALEALGVGVGWFPVRALSVTLRASHVFVSGGKHAAFHGASVQWFAHPRVWIGVGPGLVTYGGLASFAAQAPEASDRAGFGVQLRAGAALFATARHAINVCAQIYPGFFRDGVVLAGGLTLEWQLR